MAGKEEELAEYTQWNGQTINREIWVENQKCMTKAIKYSRNASTSELNTRDVDKVEKVTSFCYLGVNKVKHVGWTCWRRKYYP